MVDLSNFYFDIIKDRLYCGDEAGRRSAQTALYRILDGMTRLIAPILAFTSEEIWAAMPHDKSADAAGVLFNDMPEYDAALVLSESDAARWAANRALQVAPFDELLLGERIRTEQAAGRVDEVDRLVQRVYHQARQLGSDLLPETIDLIQECVEGQLRARRA